MSHKYTSATTAHKSRSRCSRTRAQRRKDRLQEHLPELFIPDFSGENYESLVRVMADLIQYQLQRPPSAFSLALREIEEVNQQEKKYADDVNNLLKENT